LSEAVLVSAQNHQAIIKGIVQIQGADEIFRPVVGRVTKEPPGGALAG